VRGKLDGERAIPVKVAVEATLAGATDRAVVGATWAGEQRGTGGECARYSS
jgi:hypothetical protein